VPTVKQILHTEQKQKTDDGGQVVHGEL